MFEEDPPDVYVFPGKLTQHDALKLTAERITRDAAAAWDEPADVENGPSEDDVPPVMTIDFLLEIYFVTVRFHELP